MSAKRMVMVLWMFMLSFYISSTIHCAEEISDTTWTSPGKKYSKDEVKRFFAKYAGGVCKINSKLYELKTGKKLLKSEAVIAFLDDKGEIKKELRFQEYQKSVTDPTRTIERRYWKNHETAILFISEIKSEDGESDVAWYLKGEIIRYNKNGNEMYRRKMMHCITRGELSPKGGKFLFSCGNSPWYSKKLFEPYAVLIDEQGKELFSWKGGGRDYISSNMRFSPSGKFLVMSWGKESALGLHSCELIDLDTMKIRNIKGPIPVGQTETRTEYVRRSVTGVTDSGDLIIGAFHTKKEGNPRGTHIYKEEIWNVR